MYKLYHITATTTSYGNSEITEITDLFYGLLVVDRVDNANYICL